MSDVTQYPGLLATYIASNNIQGDVTASMERLKAALTSVCRNGVCMYVTLGFM